MKIAVPFVIKRGFGEGKTQNLRTSRKRFRVYAFAGTSRDRIGLGTLEFGKFPSYASGSISSSRSKDFTVLELPPMTVLRRIS